MYTLLHSQALRRLVVAREGISMVVALAVAESFYKFHSFILEAIGFVVTWYLIGWVAELASGLRGDR